MSQARETQPARVPERANQAGEIVVRWTEIEPWTGTARLVTALEPGVNGGAQIALVAEPGLSNWSPAPALVRQSSFEVRPPTGEPYAGDPPVRFGGGRDATQCVLPTPIPGGSGRTARHLVRLRRPG